MAGAGLGVAWWVLRAPGAPAPAAAAGPCVLAAEQTEGPFYVPGEPVRSDVTEDSTGIPLRLRIKVEDVATCRRLRGATVEIWHADAAGDYSGVGGAATTFLRGQQATDRAGRVRFTTIYPGWYPGRTAHVHVKVHVAGAVVHTGQLYFPDAVTTAVYAHQPYAARGTRSTTNATDAIYASGGARSLLALRRQGRQGLRGRITLAVRT